MAIQQNSNLASQVIVAAAQRVRTLAQQTAAHIGRPIDAQAPSTEEQARLWNLQNPQADMAQVQSLVDAGKHAQAVDLLYPWRSKLFGSGSPADKVQKAEALSNIATKNAQSEGNMTSEGPVNY